jgi:PTH1 family peptidyl-tRNA hydrolase
VRLFRRESREDTGDRWVIIGLANPGRRYDKTRHNVGVRALQVLLDRTNSSVKSHKSGCLIAETNLDGSPVVLARSTTYMNETGRPLGQLMRWYKTQSENLVVIHDEIDIPFEDVRVKFGGGTAGHNGLKSISSHLGTKDFARVRIGVSRPPGRKEAADHVLNEFSAAEERALPEILERAADAAELVVAKGIERAMNEVNTRSN